MTYVACYVLGSSLRVFDVIDAAVPCPEGVGAEGEVAIKMRLRLRELHTATTTDSVRF